MRRSTDICTCDHARDDHYMVVRMGPEKHENACTECPCLGFFPHPQPTSAPPQKPFTLRLESALLSMGDFETRELVSGAPNRYRISNTVTGECWEVTAKRIS